MVSSMYEKSKLYNYGILETFAIVKTDCFEIQEGIRTKDLSLLSYVELLNKMQNDSRYMYIYVEQRKRATEIPNLNKNIVISNDPFHFFLMDEMENGFKNCKIPLSQSEKTNFCRFLSDFITIERKIPTIKDFIPHSELLIYEENTFWDWSLKIINKIPAVKYCAIEIPGHNFRVCNSRDLLISEIKSWIKKGTISSNLDSDDTQQILRLLKYFVGYDYEKDKDEIVEKEYFTEKEIDHLNKVIDMWGDLIKGNVAEHLIFSLKPVLKYIIKEIKIGSLNDE